MGVGGDNSWGARPHEEFRLPGREYAYRFLIRPLEGTSPEELEGRTRRVPEGSLPPSMQEASWLPVDTPAEVSADPPAPDPPPTLR